MMKNFPLILMSFESIRFGDSDYFERGPARIFGTFLRNIVNATFIGEAAGIAGEGQFK